MSLSSRDLARLRCPATGQPLRQMSPERLLDLNGRIAMGEAKHPDGSPVEKPLSSALETSDGARAYPLEDGLPVMLSDRAVTL